MKLTRVLALCTAWVGFTIGIGDVNSQNFKPLFNGRDLSGWVEMGEPGGFVVEENTLFLKTPRNYPNWLRTEREYENFILKLEYMTAG